MMIDIHQQTGVDPIHTNIWCQKYNEALICTLTGLLTIVDDATSQEQGLMKPDLVVFFYAKLS